MSKRLLIPLALFILTCKAARADQSVNFDHVLKAAVTKSYDLKLAKTDSHLAQNDIKQARVAYLPTSRLTGNYEYQYGFSKSNVPVTAVGNVILPTGTRFQDAVTITTMYTLCDFGVRKNTLDAANAHAQASVLQIRQANRDLRLRLIDAYCEALGHFKGLNSKRKILDFYQQLYVAKQRLCDAGNVSKVDVMEQAIKVAKTLDEINELKQKLAISLQELSTHTHEDYDPEHTVVSDLNDEPIFFQSFVAEQTPEFKYYNLEIARKRNELRALTRQRMPQIGGYSNFVMYGMNPYNPGGAFSSFSGRTVSLGVSLNWSIFDGFKNEADREKTEVEIERLKTERDQKVWALRKQGEKALADADLYRVQMATKAEIVSQRGSKSSAYKRLVDKQATDKSAWLSEQAQLAEHQLDLDKADIQRRAAQMKLNVLAAAQ